MTAFQAIQHYSSWSVLLVGLLTFGGLLGTGRLLLVYFRWQLPHPWYQPTALVLGVQLLSLTVQAAAITRHASPRVLIFLWSLIVTVGWMKLGQLFVAQRWHFKLPVLQGQEWIFLGVALSCLVNLLVALAPATKIDEIYYHMLTPARLVNDQALIWYHQPWEAAMMPHMSYQLALAPLHALGVPDAGNVVSWGLLMLLLWWFGHLVTGAGYSRSWAGLGMAVVLSGLHSTVWFTTGGSHALGILSFAVALVGLVYFTKLCAQTHVAAVAGMCSLMLVTAISCKLSMLLLGFLLWLGCVFYAWRQSHHSSRKGLWLSCCLPWLLGLLPLMLWTYGQTGAPFGPLLGRYFPHSIFQSAADVAFFQTTKMGDVPFSRMLRETVLQYHPLLWTGTIVIFWRKQLTRVVAALFALCCLIQLVLIVFALPFDLRFLGGLPYGLFIVFCLLIPRKWQEACLLTPWRYAALCLCLTPWILLQLYFARPFAAVVLGTQPATHFCERYVALCADFQKLDEILPKNAVLLNEYLRVGNVYAPRPVYLDVADLPAGKDVYLMVPGQPESWLRQARRGNYQMGEVVYSNPQAVMQTFRQPGMPAVRGHFSVVKLNPQTGKL